MIFESYSERGWSITDSGHDELAISRLKSEVEKAGAVFDRARVQWQRIRDSEDRQAWICYRYDDPNIPVPEEWRDGPPLSPEKQAQVERFRQTGQP